jgi:predicted PurR-regulated permease PerM
VIKVEVSFRGLLLLLGLLALAWTLIELWPVILLLTVSLILMLGLLPYVDALVRRGIPRTLSVLLLLGAILVLIFGLLSAVVPAMVTEFQDVRDNLPETAREVEGLLAGIGINVELEERARNIDWGRLLSGRVAVDYGQRLLSITVSVITVIVLTAYLLADAPRLSRFIHQFIPEDRKDEADLLFLSLMRVVGGYLRGQVITSAAIGVFTFVFLRIVGAPNPLAFAVLAAIADVIPLVGALIATVPPVAAALQQSATQAAIVLAGLMAYQQFEDRYLAPRVYGRTLNLPAIIVLIAVLAGAELLGIVGVLLALPLTAAGRVGLDYIIEHRRLPLMSQSLDQPWAPDIPPRAAGRTLRRRRRRQGVAGTVASRRRAP